MLIDVILDFDTPFDESSNVLEIKAADYTYVFNTVAVVAEQTHSTSSQQPQLQEVLSKYQMLFDVQLKIYHHKESFRTNAKCGSSLSKCILCCSHALFVFKMNSMFM